MDRKKDMIISGGFNIYPSDLEAVLARPRGDRRSGRGRRRLRAMGRDARGVRRAEGRHGAGAEEIRDWLNGQVGKTQRLSAVEIVPALPRSAIGKVLKRELRDGFAGRGDAWGMVRRSTRMGLLDGRVAIVTGASKGIGRALSLRFAREGAAVVCAARSADLVEAAAGEVRAAGGKAIAVVCDAAREDDVARMVSAGAKAFGKIDLLVNNAGDSGPTKRVQDYLMEDWRYTIDSCLTSSYLCTRFVVPEMVKAGGGAIVNISSGAGRRGLPYRIGYCAAKAGQVGMTFGMALELAPHNIRVNCVAPGAVEGERIDQVIAGQAKARGIGVEEMRKAMIARSPLNRMVTADDIVDATVFLCSDMARNISGQVLAVNAGQPAG